MNPDQLLETTMNPMSRTLQLVSLRWKTPRPSPSLSPCSWADKVEPRREFIEKNAKEVRSSMS